MPVSRLFAYMFPRQVSVTHRERLLSALGAFAAIFIMAALSRYFIGAENLPYLAASMGASAVLLLAVPHSPFSQPWALLGGHTVAALVGIACIRLVPDPLVATALALGLTVLAMFYLRCLHPPGGGTALLGAIGGAKIQALGFWFVLTPVLVNAVLLLLVALLINRLIPHRHYPAYHAQPATIPPPSPKLGFGHADLVAALEEIDEVIDVTEDDLEYIYQLAIQHNQKRRTPTTP